MLMGTIWNVVQVDRLRCVAVLKAVAAAHVNAHVVGQSGSPCWRQYHCSA